MTRTTFILHKLLKIGLTVKKQLVDGSEKDIIQTVPTGQQRLFVSHGGGEKGFIPNAQTIFKSGINVLFGT